MPKKHKILINLNLTDDEVENVVVDLQCATEIYPDNAVTNRVYTSIIEQIEAQTPQPNK